MNKEKQLDIKQSQQEAEIQKLKGENDILLQKFSECAQKYDRVKNLLAEREKQIKLMSQEIILAGQQISESQDMLRGKIFEKNKVYKELEAKREQLKGMNQKVNVLQKEMEKKDKIFENTCKGDKVKLKMIEKDLNELIQRYNELVTIKNNLKKGYEYLNSKYIKCQDELAALKREPFYYTMKYDPKSMADRKQQQKQHVDGKQVLSESNVKVNLGNRGYSSRPNDKKGDSSFSFAKEMMEFAKIQATATEPNVDGTLEFI